MVWCSPALALRSVKHSAMNKHTMKKMCLALLIYFFSHNAYAVDLQTALQNLSNIIVPLTALVLVASYIAGIVMIFSGLMHMKKLGNVGTQTSQPGEFGGPFLKIIIGGILIYLPTSTDVLMNSLFSTGTAIFSGGGVASLSDYQSLGVGATLLGYTGSDALSAQWQSLANTLVLYIQFLGLLSFIKGWFIMSHAGGQGAQQGSFGKGLTHIIGGIIAINFTGVVTLIGNTILGTG